jgi:two-component system response regulator AtoC
MQRLFEKMRHAAPHLRIAAIEGEPGTGKALAAHTLHAEAARNETPQISGPCPRPALVTCAAARALSVMDDLFRESQGGTLYLSHTHELSPEQQREWLEMVEHFERCHAAHAASSMPRRLLFGSCEPLRRMTAGAAFLPGLAHRLTAIRFTLPALREHREDIPLLVEILLDRLRIAHGKAVRGLAPGTLPRLMSHSWPGNVRELETVLSNALLDCVSEWIRPIDIPTLAWPCAAGPQIFPTRSAAPIDDPAPDLDPDLDRAILRHITRVLARVNGNKLRAARLLGISRSTLYRLLESGGIYQSATE